MAEGDGVVIDGVVEHVADVGRGQAELVARAGDGEVDVLVGMRVRGLDAGFDAFEMTREAPAAFSAQLGGAEHFEAGIRLEKGDVEGGGVFERLFVGAAVAGSHARFSAG